MFPTTDHCVRPGPVVYLVRAVGPRQSGGRVSMGGQTDEIDRSANVNGHC